MQTIHKKAFSLIELMIVITIIGILAAVSVPAYNTYVLKAKAVRNMGILQDVLTKVEEYMILNNNALPAPGNIAAVGVTSTDFANDDLVDINVGSAWGGNVFMRFKANFFGEGKANPAIHMYPTITNGSISWECRAQVGAANSWAIDPKYLPVGCVAVP